MWVRGDKEMCVCMRPVRTLLCAVSGGGSLWGVQGMPGRRATPAAATAHCPHSRVRDRGGVASLAARRMGATLRFDQGEMA